MKVSLFGIIFLWICYLCHSDLSPYSCVFPVIFCVYLLLSCGLAIIFVYLALVSFRFVTIFIWIWEMVLMSKIQICLIIQLLKSAHDNKFPNDISLETGFIDYCRNKAIYREVYPYIHTYIQLYLQNLNHFGK